MRLKTRPEDVSAHEMSDWLAWLRAEAIEESRAEAIDEPRAEVTDTGDSEAEPGAVAPAPALGGGSPASGKAPASGKTIARHEDTCRALIGDELRIPTAWCEMGSCISYHTDPVALGEADVRSRALRAGWRLDLLGRLACVDCQRTSPWYRTAYPVVPWDRQEAVATAAMMAAALRHDGGHGGTHAAPSPVTPAVDPLASPPTGQGIGGRHRKQQ